jgi:hypothetical protein
MPLPEAAVRAQQLQQLFLMASRRRETSELFSSELFSSAWPRRRDNVNSWFETQIANY